MHASNKPERPDAPELDGVLGARAPVVRAMWDGSLGCTVRCVPTRRTVAVPFDGGWLFGKWRVGHRGDAAAEWHWLHVLPLLGLRVPEPVAWIGRGRRSLLVTAGLAGRAMDAWIVEAAAQGWLPELVAWACRRVAPVVRRLHDRGLVYRDLYWNHVFVAAPRDGAEPHFLDVERVFRPRLWPRRWRIKDLAGLLSSVPAGVPLPRFAGLRFLRHYLGEPLRDHLRLLRAIDRKAARIRAHRPRYG